MEAITLKKKIVDVIHPKAPFNFNGTVFIPQHFPTPDFEFKDGIFWSSMIFNEMLLGIKMENEGTTSRPKIKLTVYSRKNLSQGDIYSVVSELKWRYGLDEDLGEFSKLFKNDKHLRMPLKNGRA